MISCRLDVSNVSENFVSFQAKSIIHLVTQLDEISQKIQHVGISDLSEVDVHIQLNGISVISSADTNALCNFVSAKTNVLYRLHLKHDDCMPEDIIAILQKRLDISFWRALTTWHQKKSVESLELPLKNLLSVLYPHGLPAPSLMITQDTPNLIIEPLLQRQAFPNLDKKRASIAVPESKVKECIKIDLDGQSALQKYQETVLQVLPHELVANILACVGLVGLTHLCELLNFFDKEDLQNLIDIFFNDCNLLEMLHLVTPRGLKYIEVCAHWPKNLVKHWLHWLNNNSGATVSFFDAVTLMDCFWQKIKHRHPEISLEKAHGVYPFVERISEMLAFLESLPEESRKIQILFLFSLDWNQGPSHSTQLKRYLEILKTNKLIFISKAMLQQPIESLLEHIPLHQANESSCLQYIAMHLQDKSQTAIQTIKNYLQECSNEVGYQLAAWCACGSTTISSSVFRELHQLISMMPLEQCSIVFQEMFALEKNKRFSTDELRVLLSIVNGQKDVFFGLIKFYRSWSIIHQEDFARTWRIITNYLVQDPRPSTIAMLFSISLNWLEQGISANHCYFQALISCLAKDEDRRNELIWPQINSRFSQLPELKQAELISIIASYDFSKKNRLCLSSLAILLSQNIEENTFCNLFNHYFPNGDFLYFKSSIDYQLVFNSIEDLISSVQESINFFLSDEKIFGILKIKGLLLGEVHKKLEAQQHLLNQFLKELKYLKTQKNEIDLTGLFSHLKEFEVFFHDFINWELGRIFGEKSWLLSGFAISGPLIHQLDPSLNAKSSLRDLMDKVLKHHQLVSQSPIGYHFQFEILKIMITSSEIPMLQRYLDNRLVKAITEKLNGDILSELSNSIIPREKLSLLVKFLHQLPLNQVGLNAFFQRYLAIKTVLKRWMTLEERLIRIEIDPESVWDILLRHQLHNGQAHCVAHWQVGMSLLNHLIDWHNRNLIPSQFSILNFLDSFFAAKNSLKFMELDSLGELRHVNWKKLLEDLQQAIKTYSHHPMFLNILPKSIEHILIQGESYNFEQGLEVFSGFSQNPQLIPRLYQLMNHADKQIRLHVGNILLIISEMLAKKDRRPWQKFIIKLFGFADFDHHIIEIEALLTWLNHESDFYCWIELIAFDENASLTDILSLKDIFKRPGSAWIKLYERVYKSKAFHESASAPSNPSGNRIRVFFSKIFSYFWTSDVSPVIQSRGPSLDEQIMLEAWSLWSKAPYPDLRRLLTWLQSHPQNIALELQDFDRFPLGQLSTYDYSRADIERWMAELEFYEAAPPSKVKLARRLEQILVMINEFLLLPRTHLIREFHSLKQRIHAQDPQHQHQLIALVASIYYKSTNRKPYPTQLLTILLTFEYHNGHLIFEVDTGEGKGITTALLAVLKWALRDKATIEVRTANRDLVKQDFYEKGHWQFFKLLDIVHAVIEQDTAPECYQEGGIYYTTQDDMMVFQENRRLAGFVDSFSVDILADEVDSLLLDQKSLINLAYQSSELSDYIWIYPAINQFIDEYGDLNHDASNSHLSSSVSIAFQEPDHGTTIKGQRLIQQYGFLLKQVLIEENKNKIYRLIQIEKISSQQWQDWLITALYARTLLENKDYLVEEVEVSGQRMYKAMPYINGEVKYGFELSFQMKAGLTQFLHARLDSAARPFIMQPESRIISQLPALDLRNINSFVGLSGSIGSMSELFDMLQSTCAHAVRIPRFYPASLKVLPNILVDDSYNLNQTLAEMASSTANPLLFVTEKIEDAHCLYESLKGLFPKRAIKLLTGQESEIERRDWLHANEGYHYAGSANSITVATLICGRGTDIIVKNSHYLEVKQIGVLGPRNGVQIQGRTARVNARGSYQVIYSREILLRDWGFFNSHLPSLNVSTLNLWVEKIQDQLIFQNRQSRLHLRMKGWCQKHLFGNLTTCLEHTDIDELGAQTYHLFVAKELEALTKQISQQNLNVEDYIKGCSLIWSKVLIKFEMAGFEHPFSTQAIFFNSLVADSNSALRLVSQTLTSENESRDKTHSQNSLSDKDLADLNHRLNKWVPEESLNFKKQNIPWYALIRRLKLWLFETSALVKHTNECLHKSWRTFNQKPSYENWEDFYQNLLVAVKLYSQQEKESIWNLSYWFPSLNPLSSWQVVFQEVKSYFIERALPLPQNTIVYEEIKKGILKKFQVKDQVSQLWQDIIDWWWKLMSFFNRDIESALKALQKTAQTFTETPNQATLNKLFQHVHQAKVLFLECSQWRSMRFGYWVYWQKRCQVWLDLADELEVLIKTSNSDAFSLNDWQTHQEKVSNLQLDYRTELLNKAENIALLSQYSFWRSKSQSGAVYQINTSFENHLRGRALIQQQIHELGKLYPAQTQELYQLFNPHADIADVQVPKNAYSMILSIIYAYANPSQSQSVQLHLSARPMTVLISELQRLSKRRELLIEWDAHQTSIEVIF